MYSSAYVLIFVVSFGVLYSAYRRYSRISIADIPGPKPDSYLLGNYTGFFLRLILISVIGSSNQLLLPECGVTEARWQEEFGSIFRFKASLGVSIVQALIERRTYSFCV